MSGRIVDGGTLRGEHTIDADVVVCGAGAGGSMAARQLARSGRRVVVLEAGEDHGPGHFTQREDEMFPKLFAQAGGQRTEDLSIVILSGRGLGGSTVHNTNLCKRAAPEILHHWRDDLGVDGLGPDDLAPFYELVEHDLSVQPIDEARVNRLNRMMRAGVETLGYRGAVLSHNRDANCIGSGFCELGCAYDGKLNARRILVPQAVDAGATFYTRCTVTRVLHDAGRATGVQAVTRDERGDVGTVAVRAPVVCLASSAIGSAALALRSGLPDPHAQLGEGLRIHPAAVVAGAFDEQVEGWRGIPQSYECTQFLDLAPGSSKRVWIIPSFAHPAGTASIMPGFGPALFQGMRRYARLVVLTAVVHDETRGRVTVSGDRTKIAYAPNDADRAQLALGAREAGKILFAAGAREVVVPALPPLRARSARELAALDASRYLPHDAKVMSVHPMGTLRMGKSPESSSTDARGSVWGVGGLWVADGSLFPTSIGGPPQLSIYAFGARTAASIIGGE